VIQSPVESPVRPRVLLLGEPSARPAGLERALTRAGFQLVEREDQRPDPEADAILITLKDTSEGPLNDLLATPAAAHQEAPPRIVVFASPDPDAAAAALCLGAGDAVAAPIHLPELCARVHARIRAHSAAAEVNGRLALNGSRPSEPATVQTSASEALDGRIREEFERARRYSLSFSLILLGVDELEGVRERQGPEAADRLRREVADVLRRELRVPDFVVGYGTSEFAIVLPETGPAGARQSVLRVRERLGVVPTDGDPRLEHPRFSAGIVTYPHPAVSHSDELYAIVEAALMRGKGQSVERIGVAV
jgi:diguanylate cyclase (GGDEF)-like protein